MKSVEARALAFVRAHGVVLESARGVVPSLADEIAGGRISGSWWRHARGRAIFRATRAVRDSADVVVCRLLAGRVTYVHRRLWPAVVKLADEIGPRRLDAVRERHTASGAHQLVTVRFPRWVSTEVKAAAAKLSRAEARELCRGWLK
jgi:hypothetical protein